MRKQNSNPTRDSVVDKLNLNLEDFGSFSFEDLVERISSDSSIKLERVAELFNGHTILQRAQIDYLDKQKQARLQRLRELDENIGEVLF